MENEKKVLRYIACMVDDPQRTASLAAADHGRRFIFQYFLGDDTISIFEPPARNSGRQETQEQVTSSRILTQSIFFRVGIIGGKFLERRIVNKPNTTEPYTASDMYVGAQLCVATRLFQLLEADEFTYAYMESKPELFSLSDYTAVMSKIKGQTTGMCTCKVPDSLLKAPMNGDTDLFVGLCKQENLTTFALHS